MEEVKNPQWGDEFCANRSWSRFPHSTAMKSLQALGLSTAEAWVAIVLLGHSYNGVATVPNRLLAERTGVTVRLVQRAIGKMVRLGLGRSRKGKYAVALFRDRVFEKSGGESGGEECFSGLLQEADRVRKTGVDVSFAVRTGAAHVGIEITPRVAGDLASRLDEAEGTA